MREMTDDEEKQFVKQMGCMGGLFHLFDRPQILSSRRFKYSSSQTTESVSPSERSDESGPLGDRETISGRPPSPEQSMDAKRSSVSVFKTTTTWKLREAPRLSLDSRLRPREIRTTVDRVQESDDSDRQRRSPSVVARLMGVDVLPTGSDSGCLAELRRSASESRLPRESSYYRFVDSCFDNNRNKPVLPDPVRKAESNPRVTYIPPPFQRKSCFEPEDFFPEPKRSTGTVTLYGEIERRLRKRGIDEPAKDLETLKQILEALQLKGLLHSPPAHRRTDHRRLPAGNRLAGVSPPIVLMRPPKPPLSPKREPVSPASGNRSAARRRAGVSPPRRDRVEVDRGFARRPRSLERKEMVNSPSSPVRRRSVQNVESPTSPQQVRRISAVHSDKITNKKGGPERTAVRLPVNRQREPAVERVWLPAEDDTSPSVSESSVSTSSHLDLEMSRLDGYGRPGHGLLERCDKLLTSIAAITSSEQSTGVDQQPSPVSVLDSSFLCEESSPSPVTKRSINFKSPNPNPNPNPNPWPMDQLMDSEEEDQFTVGSEMDDPDYLYILEIFRVSHRHGELSDAYASLEKQYWLDQSSSTEWLHRRLVFDTVVEIVENKRNVSPCDAFKCQQRRKPLIRIVWDEFRCRREQALEMGEFDDLNEATCGVIRKDMAADTVWARPSAELSDAVLQIERLIFKDLVADTIHQLADVFGDESRVLPRRKLMF